MKSSVDDIRRRFDADVERFSNLETGQSATVDAPLAMALVAQAAAATTPHARHVLDVRCGAGLHSQTPPAHSQPERDAHRPEPPDARQSDRADQADRRPERSRRSRATSGEVELGEEQFDIVVAAAVLHHLRTDEEWRAVFTAAASGAASGRVDMGVRSGREYDSGGQRLMWRRYGEYLSALKGRGVPGPRLRLRRAGGHAPPAHVPTRLAPEVGFACRLRCCTRTAALRRLLR